MKLVTLLALILSLNVHAQDYDNCKKMNNYTAEPDSYNSFTSGNTISWAGYFSPLDFYSFLNCPIGQDSSIYDYLITQQKNGAIKSYGIDSLNEVAAARNNFDDGGKLDSLKHIRFDQILYMEDHQLKSRVIDAAVTYQLYDFTGNLTGSLHRTRCCLNKNDSINNSTDKIIFLNTSYKLFNGDSSYAMIDNIKATYGMNLVTALWYDLSKGYNRLIDLNTNKKIDPINVWLYSGVDSIEQPKFNNSGEIEPNSYTMIAGTPIISDLSTIGIYQEWYYDVTKNIFFNKIKQVDIYTALPKKDNKIEVKKRFKVLFN